MHRSRDALQNCCYSAMSNSIQKQNRCFKVHDTEMLDRAKRLSSSPDLFSKECQDLKKMFLKLKYPAKLIDSTFKRFLAAQDKNQNRIEPADSPVRITLPYKDQKSADSVRRQLSDLGKKIDRVIQPVFTSRKISEDLKVTEANHHL